MNKRSFLLVGAFSIVTSVTATPVQFEDTSIAAGMEGHSETWGLSWGDFNGDNWPDLFYQGHRIYPRMYQNTGAGTFEDVAYQYDPGDIWINDIFNDTHGATLADIDNDGDDDILISVSASGPAQLLVNNINTGGGFSEQGFAANIAQDRTARLGVWFDYNNDGLLDLIQHYTYGSYLRRRNTSSLSYTDSLMDPCPGHGDYGQLADLNNDGTLDYICGRQGDFPQFIYDYSSGSFSDITSVLPFTNNVNDTIVGDFNNDLKTDMVMVRGTLRPSGSARTGTNSIEAWFRGGNPGFTFSATGEVTITVDYEGIGAHSAPDVRVLNTSGPTSASIANEVSINYSSGQWTVTYIGTRQAYVQVHAANAVSDPVNFGQELTELPMEMMHAVNSGIGLNYIYNTGLFVPVSCASGVTADFDNDMDLDIYLACRQGARNLPNRYYDNQGNGTFVLATSHGGEGPVGAGLQFGTSDSVVTADYDVDGFMDLAVANGLQFYPYGIGGIDSLIRNKGNANHWVELDLVGSTSNRDGVGAKVFATAGGVIQLREQNTGTHRWSQNHKRIHFGLAANTSVDITVQWPSGQTDTYTNVTVDRLYKANEGGAITPAVLGPVIKTTVSAGDECGEPPYSLDYGPAVLVWRDCPGNTWHVRMKGGREKAQKLITAGSIIADAAFASSTPINLTGADVLTSPANVLDFSVGTWFTNDRGFDLNTGSQSTACMSFTTQDIASVIVGSSHKRIDGPLDLVKLGSCSVDSDGDGIPDSTDPDDDNDGVPDVNDAFPLNAAESVDTDGDGIGNNADTDDDNDGVRDNLDAFPLDPNESLDTDNDGIGNNTDTDDDGDGVLDMNDAFPLDPTETADSDGDGVGDNSDPAPNDPNIPNNAPVILQPGNQNIVVGDAVNLVVTAYVAGNNAITYAATGLPAGLTLGSTGIITGSVATTGTSTVTVTATDSTGKQSSSSFVVTATSTTTTLISENFSGGTGVFSYADDIFRNTNAASYASGTLSSGTLKVLLGGINNTDIFGMSGGWQTSFQLASATNVSISFRYNLTQTEPYESDEYSQALFSLDGNLIGVSPNNYLAQVTGDGQGSPRVPISTGWRTFQVSLGTLSAGQHTIAIGGYNNKKTYNDESTDILIDDVVVTAAGSGSSNTAPALTNVVTQTSSINDVINLQLNSNDADGDILDYQAIGLPASLAVDSLSGLISGNLTQTGSNSVTAVVYDGRGSSASRNFSWQVSGSSGNNVFCGDPVLDSATERATFLWQDCATATWHLRVTGGGTPSRIDYIGKITVPGGLTSVTAVALEANDIVDTSNLNALNYQFIIYNKAMDGIDFVAPANTCFIPQSPSNLPVYLGGNRTLLTAGDVSLDTGAACPLAVDSDNDGLSDDEEATLGTNPNLADTDGGGVNDGDEVNNGTDPLNPLDDVNPVADACGQPTYDSGSDLGLFLWKDCSYAGPEARWTLRITGGGTTFSTYSGLLSSDSTLAVTGFSLEGSDVLDSTQGDSIIDYVLKAGNAGQDGFQIDLPAGSATCFEPQSLPAGAQVQIGAGRRVMNGAFSLETLQSCSGATAHPGCGMPTFDTGAEPGLYLWKDCSAGGADALWEVRAVGGGLPWAEYAGALTATSTLAATGVSLEASDILDSVANDATIDYSLKVGGGGLDGFSTVIPNGAQSCFSSQLIPAGSNVFVGKDKLLQTADFNLEDLGVCQ